ncbi:ATP-dependent DNA helicase RecG [Gammaproteobacteria bacterium]|nr:ATP-dependent DNA helicase RecG [Gammaproteobacteria bacterium]
MSNDLRSLRGVGPAIEEKLTKLDVHNQTDLLFLMPIRYEDRTLVTPIGALNHDQQVLIQGRVLLTNIVYRGRRTLLSQLSDDTGMVTLRFFSFSNQQAKNLSRNTLVRCFGRVRKTATGVEIIHPEYQIIDPDNIPPLASTLTPIYPSTKGLSQGKLRSMIKLALDSQLNSAEELLPKEIADLLHVMPLGESLEAIHSPPKTEQEEGFSPAKLRLVTEELIANQLALKRIKRTTQLNKAIALKNIKEKNNLIKQLLFTLTNSQERVVREIEEDLMAPRPMMRLLQGDVGSGKTVVAALAIAIAAGSNAQAAFMAPTELLAEQHYNNLKVWFDPLGIQVVLLKSKLPAKEKKQILGSIEDGTSSIIIGTHALFQGAVNYNNLALVVVDEQHRFGVDQRLSLMNKSISGSVPHQLIMTATPIPRTLAMTAYGDLDSSVINELPKGRGTIETVVVSEEKREGVVSRVMDEIKKNRQIYWVCPLIEESEELNFEAVETTHKNLKSKLKNCSIGLVHGKLDSLKKTKAMLDFKNGKQDVLVATTVIEVGVDVANASIMVIENSERLGLSQLHQLRGRVGRGEHKSICILIYKKPLSSMAKMRLSAIRESNDGFYISEKDLELRGPGELLGTKQKGIIGLKIADIARDAHLLPKINKLCADFEENYPKQAEKLIHRWVGNQIEYRKV